METRVYTRHEDGTLALYTQIDDDGRLCICDDNVCEPVESEDAANKMALEIMEAWLVESCWENDVEYQAFESEIKSLRAEI